MFMHECQLILIHSLTHYFLLLHTQDHLREFVLFFFNYPCGASCNIDEYEFVVGGAEKHVGVWMRMILITTSRLVRVIHDVWVHESNVILFCIMAEDSRGLNVSAMKLECLLVILINLKRQLFSESTAATECP